MSALAEQIRTRYDRLAPWSGRAEPPRDGDIEDLEKELAAMVPADGADRAAMAEAEELIGRLRALTAIR
jgi:hypothetical protein